MTASSRRVGATLFALVTLMLTAPSAMSQTTKMPSTLRWGSGLIDVPVASVLPHLAITGTYSGFNTSIERTLLTDAQGDDLLWQVAGHLRLAALRGVLECFGFGNRLLLFRAQGRLEAAG